MLVVFVDSGCWVGVSLIPINFMVGLFACRVNYYALLVFGFVLLVWLHCLFGWFTLHLHFLVVVFDLLLALCVCWYFGLSVSFVLLNVLSTKGTCVCRLVWLFCFCYLLVV